jgi:hypothetical protein
MQTQKGCPEERRLKVSLDPSCSFFSIAYHGPIQDGVERRANHSDRILVITPLRRCMQDMVEEFEHVVIVADLLMTDRVILVRLLCWYLRKHRVDKDVDTGVLLNQILELLQYRVKPFWVVLDAIDNVGQPFFVYAVIRREPVSCPVQLMLVRHVFCVLLM